MAHVWSESDVQEILKMRSCRQGIEYLIGWKNGERPTWELRDSFNKCNMFDKFDALRRKRACEQFPLFTYHQRAFRKRRLLSCKSMYKKGFKPEEITGLVDVFGKAFALMSYFGTDEKDFVRWEVVTKLFPDLAADFLEKRGMGNI